MMGIREVFCSEFQAMSKGSNSVFNGVSLSEGCKIMRIRTGMDRIITLSINLFSMPQIDNINYEFIFIYRINYPIITHA